MRRYATVAFLTLFIVMSHLFAQSSGKDVSKDVSEFFPENSFQDAYITPDSTVHVTLRYYGVIMNAMYVYSPSGCIVARDLFSAVLHSTLKVFATLPAAQKVDIRCIQVPDDAAGGPTTTRCWFSVERSSLTSQAFKDAVKALPTLGKSCSGKETILKAFSDYYLDGGAQRDLTQ
ncbi:MAG: hypothetical protein M1378_06835 [Bacteroidetes bacterium]|jgi:hypothetical protein|nr:hypothetical protein [Bacteroidota bacterium]MCL5034626.1 hypothetical protein [Bacteroidota bacterium]